MWHPKWHNFNAKASGPSESNVVGMDGWMSLEAATTSFHCASQGGRGPAHLEHPMKVFMGPHGLCDVATRLPSASLVPACRKRGEHTLHSWTLGTCWGLENLFNYPCLVPHHLTSQRLIRDCFNGRKIAHHLGSRNFPSALNFKIYLVSNCMYICCQI